MNITVEVEGINDLVSRFEAVQEGVADLRKNATWLRVQQAFYRVMKDHFAGEGTGASGKWKALSSPYKEIKAAKYGNLPILQRTGRLYKSLTRDGGDAIVDKQATSMTLGTKVPYAGYHQSGTGRMPSRPPIDFTEAQKDVIAQPIADSLKQLIANQKLRGLRGF